MVIRLEWLVVAWFLVGVLRDSAAISGRAVLVAHIIILALAVLALILSLLR